jgi:2-dehydro-3-deoxyphosphooctonate aldolase (KDO 8-P synthase)|tara:strand:- start:4034 stop:4792 length:759 start_codon:yes stop_codon:yes gene_type:complete
LRIIAGPCQHETLFKSLEIAEHCQEVCDKYDVEYYFKASYDKANRSHVDNTRGVGLHDTIKDFLQMEESIGVKILTDVHEIEHIQYLKDVVKVLQIPAFLCRQTDLIQAACKTNCIVNIKKGQFLAPADVYGILSKTDDAKEVWITERGTSFGYGRLINDFTGMYDILCNLHGNFVYDVTHSVQQPGGTSTGGNRDYVPGLARAGAALGITSFFLEVHPEPDYAPSDGANMLKLEDFEDVVKDIKRCSYESR